MSHPTISGYTFDACRGGGAFGSVWRALWNGEFECAVKVLSPGAWHAQYLSWCLERLRREGDRTGIVRIFSYDLGGGTPHVTMALMPEGSLTFEQLSARLPAREAWTLLDALAASLGWLHGEGIVHTGLSGGNVFVCPSPGGEPQVVLSDVGQGWLTGAPLARLHGQIGFVPPEHWRESMQLLQEGRAQGRDVYAFGVMAWRLLTGRWPRGEKVFGAVMSSQSEDLKLDPESFAAWLEKQPAPVWPAEAVSPEESERRKVVERCLELNPGERFAGMKEVAAALAVLALPPLPVSAEAVEEVKVEAEAEPVAAGTALTESAEQFVEPPELPHSTDGEPSLPPVIEEKAPEQEGGTEEAFGEGEPAPRRRRFSLPLPQLSLWLKRSREEAQPWWKFLLGPGAAGVSLLAVVGVAAWAFKERGGRKTALEDYADVKEKLSELESKLPRLEADLSSARLEADAARAEQAASARNRSVELINRLLASKPVEDSQLEGWRAAMHGVAEHSAKALENAPADAQGMEARWQLASLQHALGDTEATLPLLESLSRDLEAAAIAAGSGFPLEQTRLTGRVEALTGSILHAQGRMEDALPHLRKAGESLEKWTASNPDDAATVRLYAQSLLLHGLTLEDRAQLDQAKEVLIRIDGLINLPADDINAMAEERFILSDTKSALGRLRKAEAAKAAPAELEGVFNEAFQMQDEAQKLLLAYERANPKSVPCLTRLAKGYHVMGLTLARLQVVAPTLRYGQDSAVAYGEGVKVYTDLLKELPGDHRLTLELATLYGDIAQLYHDTRPGKEGAAEALEYQKGAVTYLQMLNETTPLDNTVRRHLAGALVACGELHHDAGEQGTAIERQNEALSLLNDLLAESSLTDKDRRLCRRVSARAWTALASIYEKSGKTRESISALTKAYADWEFAPVDDPADLKKMGWVKEKLSTLKPK